MVPVASRPSLLSLSRNACERARPATILLILSMVAAGVPFFETRDYVKKVMTNAAIYAALLGNKGPQLRPRLGPQIGPRDAEQPLAPDMP